MLKTIKERGEERRPKDEDLEVWVSTDPSYPPEGVPDVFECGCQLSCAAVVSVKVNA